MALFSKIKDSNLSLKGQPGPNFESEGQRVSSNIHALAKENNLISSQDMISGRFYGDSPNRTRVAPSQLDMNGKQPLNYVNSLGSNNSSNQTLFNSPTGTGFTLEKRLPFSQLGAQGKPLPTFENMSQQTTSDIQAKVRSNVLESSQDLLNGRKYGKGRFTVFISPSTLDKSGLPGNIYKNSGPKEGRY
jgi:hypothetical protein